MCAGIVWNSGPECEPVLIRSQNETSVSPGPIDVVEVGEPEVMAVLVRDDADAGSSAWSCS